MSRTGEVGGRTSVPVDGWTDEEDHSRNWLALLVDLLSLFSLVLIVPFRSPNLTDRRTKDRHTDWRTDDQRLTDWQKHSLIHVLLGESYQHLQPASQPARPSLVVLHPRGLPDKHEHWPQTSLVNNLSTLPKPACVSPREQPCTTNLPVPDDGQETHPKAPLRPFRTHTDLQRTSSLLPRITKHDESCFKSKAQLREHCQLQTRARFPWPRCRFRGPTW